MEHGHSPVNRGDTLGIMNPRGHSGTDRDRATSSTQRYIYKTFKYRHRDVKRHAVSRSELNQTHQGVRHYGGGL